MPPAIQPFANNNNLQPPQQPQVQQQPPTFQQPQQQQQQTSINDLIGQVLNPAQFQQPSQLAEAATERFTRNALPVIQNQFALQGLGQSPALGVAVGDALAGVLPDFINADIQNQRTGQQLASNLVTGREQLGQSGAGLAANIANQQQQRQLQAALGSGNLLSQFASGVTLPAAQQQAQQAQQGITGLINAGNTQQQLEQQQNNAFNAERARTQSLAEQGAFGTTGNAGLVPLLGQLVSGKG